MEKHHLYKKVLRNSIYVLLGSVVANLLLFVANLLLARLWGRAGFGRFVLVTNTNLFFILVFDFGVSLAATKFVSESTGEQKHDSLERVIFSSLIFTFLFGLVATVFLFVGSSLLAERLYNEDIGFLLKLSSLWIWMVFLLRLITAFFDGFQRMELALAVTVVTEVLRFASAIVCFLMGWSIVGAVWGWLVAYSLSLVVAALLLLWFFRREGVRWHYQWGTPRKLLGYGFYLHLPNVGRAIVPIVMNMILGWFATADDVSLYAVCQSLTTLSFLVLMPFSRALFPAASEAFAADNRDLISRIGNISLKYVGLISFVVLCGFSLLSREILWLTYGPEYVEAVGILTILAFAVFLESFRVVADPLLAGTQFARTVTEIEIARSLVAIALGMLLIKHYGTVGAALTILVAYGVNALLKMIQLRKKLAMDAYVAMRFVAPILCLLIWLYFGFPPWLLVVVVVPLVVLQRLITIKELQIILNLLWGGRKDIIDRVGVGASWGEG
jgi:stage V sporulation protein B